MSTLQPRVAGGQVLRGVDLLVGMVVAAVGTLVLGGCERQLSYARDIHPILEEHCLECHQPGGIGYRRSGLDMGTYENLMRGTKYGAVIVPGDSFDSVLIELVEHRAHLSINMPYHRARLPQRETKVLKTWIDQGAKP